MQHSDITSTPHPSQASQLLQALNPMPSQTQADPFLPTLVLTDRFVPEQGGSITWLVETYRRYQPTEVVVVTGRRTSSLQATQEADQLLPFQIERIPMAMTDWDPTRPAAFRTYAQMLWQVHAIRRRYQLQQVHCAKVLPEGLVAWGLHAVQQVPYLLYAHGEEIQTGLTSRKFRYLLPRIYNGATAIIANTAHTKNLLLEIGVQSEKIQVIHPGVETTAFQADSMTTETVRSRHGLAQTAVLLTVGRLQRRKGQDMLIRALPSIRLRFPHTKYVIVGTGEEENSLRQLAHELDVTEQVVFAGQVSEDERAAYYAVCDIFVMPNRQIGSDIEGFGMVFLEAGAAGKPVIGGKSGGTGEAILDGQTGLRVDGTQVEEIAGAVCQLLSQPAQAQAMGARGRERVETAFTWESILQRTRVLATTMQRARQRSGQGSEHGPAGQDVPQHRHAA